jgi:uncharacterized membrane protein YfcA
VSLSALDYVAAGAAAAAAGMVNAVAGGGSLISFPTLVGIGVPPVAANVTNTVALVPGYLSGTWVQRRDLQPELSRSRWLAVVAGVGGLVGSVLLVTIPASGFRAAIPYLILASSGLLLIQDWLRDRLLASRPSVSTPAGDRGSQEGDGAEGAWAPVVMGAVFLTAVYGGFFGAGLGIMLLAVLGLFSAAPLVRVNAVKQALSFVINLVAACFFAFSGHVEWTLVPIMAAASIAGGMTGGRLVRIVHPVALRRSVVAIGVAVAIAFWVV